MKKLILQIIFITKQMMITIEIKEVKETIENLRF